MNPSCTPLVSIVMPAYNCGPVLGASVESVRAQTYTHWELLIIDDASTDDTWELMQALAAPDARIRIFQNPGNYGTGKTRNLGVEKAAGDWVAFLDSDDLWRPDKLEKQVRLLREHPEGRLFFTGSGFITADGRPMDYVLQIPKRISFHKLLKQNLISCSSVLAAKESLRKYPMPEQKNIHEDFTVWLRILKEEPCAFGINEPLLLYRKSASSKSGNKGKAALMNWNTYCFIGLPFFQKVYYMAWYTILGLKKYSHL